MSADAVRTRTLVLLRHAHTLSGEDDHARVLSTRGEDEASRAAAWLQDQALGPAMLVHSDASRTSQTASAVMGRLGAQLQGRAEASLYLASAERILRVVSQSDTASACTIVVAHNPGISDLAARLAHRGGELLAGFAPACGAVFEFEGPWAEVSGAQMRMGASFRP